MSVPQQPVHSTTSGIPAMDSHLQTQGPCDPSNVVKSDYSGLQRDLLRRIQTGRIASIDFHNRDLFNVSDTGGQLMFLEVLPLFVHNSTFGILTVNLSEGPDDHPLVEYFSNGTNIGKPFRSSFTHLETFRRCMRALHSTCEECSCPKLVFVGTHKDLQHHCQHESREEKNQKLLGIIPPELKDHFFFHGELINDLLFVVNANSPDSNDRKIFADLRELMVRELQKASQD